MNIGIEYNSWLGNRFADIAANLKCASLQAPFQQRLLETQLQRCTDEAVRNIAALQMDFLSPGNIDTDVATSHASAKRNVRLCERRWVALNGSYRCAFCFRTVKCRSSGGRCEHIFSFRHVFYRADSSICCLQCGKGGCRRFYHLGRPCQGQLTAFGRRKIQSFLRSRPVVFGRMQAASLTGW